MDILSVPDPAASVEDVFRAFVDFDTVGLVSSEGDDGFALEKLRFKLPTLSSKASWADPLATADLA